MLTGAGIGASLAVFSILRTPWAGFEELVFLGAIPIGALLGLLLSPLIARDGLPAATRAFFLTIPVVAIAGGGAGLPLGVCSILGSYFAQEAVRGRGVTRTSTTWVVAAAAPALCVAALASIHLDSVGS